MSSPGSSTTWARMRLRSLGSVTELGSIQMGEAKKVPEKYAYRY